MSTTRIMIVTHHFITYGGRCSILLSFPPLPLSPVLLGAAVSSVVVTRNQGKWRWRTQIRVAEININTNSMYDVASSTVVVWWDIESCSSLPFISSCFLSFFSIKGFSYNSDGFEVQTKITSIYVFSRFLFSQRLGGLQNNTTHATQKDVTNVFQRTSVWPKQENIINYYATTYHINLSSMEV